MTMKIYSAFLLTAYISLTGCQSVEIIPPKTTPQDRPIMLMKADIPDSDGDGVFDDIDECPGTPTNVVVDERGCPHSLLFGENEFRMEARVYYGENSSEISSKYHEELDNVGKKMQDHLDAVMRVEGHISKNEENSANQILSRYRVEGIKNYLIMKYDIDPDRIKTSYYGSERPIAPNDAKDSWLNQRIYALISNVD